MRAGGVCGDRAGTVLGRGVGATAPAAPVVTPSPTSRHRNSRSWPGRSIATSRPGSRLPSIDFVGHETFDGVPGRRRLFRDEQGRSTIHICGEHPRKFDESLFLHEIAHAWDFATLDRSDRAEFAELRGVSQWWDDGVHDWDELGAEHAAEIVTWALRDRSMAVYTIPDAGCDALHAGYVALTGRPPLHGYRDRC